MFYIYLGEGEFIGDGCFSVILDAALLPLDVRRDVAERPAAFRVHPYAINNNSNMKIKRLRNALVKKKITNL